MCGIDRLGGGSGIEVVGLKLDAPGAASSEAWACLSSVFKGLCMFTTALSGTQCCGGLGGA